MKLSIWCALACTVMTLSGCPKNGPESTAQTAAMSKSSLAPRVPGTQDAATGVYLTLSTQPVTRSIQAGSPYAVILAGRWGSATPGSVYIQASDSSALLAIPTPAPAPTARYEYRIEAKLPASTPPGTYSGTLTVRACVDAQCVEPYPDTTRTITYSLHVTAVGEWETLQRSARHDGYVPVSVQPTRYRLAWTWTNPNEGALSPVVGDGERVFFTAMNTDSLYALQASNGAPLWRRVFTGNHPTVNPASVSNGTVYVTTTGHEDTFLYALRATDGTQFYRSAFQTQWGRILNPTAHNGRVFVNAGYYTGVVYAFDEAAGTRQWSVSAGTYGENTPAVDDQYVYAFNGQAMKVLDHAGAVVTTIGGTADGTYDDYVAAVVLGSTDHVLAYDGGGRYQAQRQIVNYSPSSSSVRWRSFALYAGYPAVARGVVYATSNETGSLDALDEATGRVKWSWKPREPNRTFIGNVLVTDNVVFVSTTRYTYAIGLTTKKQLWMVPTPGHLSMSSDRTLFVSSPPGQYGQQAARINAYRLD